MSHAIEYPLHTEVRTPAHLGDQHEHATEERIPVALLVLLIIGASAVALVAMAASSFTLAELGTAIGWIQWGGWLAWSLPVSVDLLAAVSGVAWLARGVPAQARRLARTITLVAVAVSVALNALSHLVESGDVRVQPWLRIAVSTVPPIVAAVGLHLVVTVARTSRTATAAPAPRPTERQPAPAETTQEPPLAALPTMPAFVAELVQPLPEPVRTLVAEVPTQVRTAYAEVSTPAFAAPEPTQMELPEAIQEWVHSVPAAAEVEEVRTEVFAFEEEVRTEENPEEGETFGAEMTPERRRELILTASAEGLSQREVALRAACSPSYVRKVLAAA